MFSKEENIQEFIKHATDVVRGFTKVGDPGDLLELLQAVKALDAKEVAYDVHALDAPCSVFLGK